MAEFGLFICTSVVHMCLKATWKMLVLLHLYMCMVLMYFEGICPAIS